MPTPERYAWVVPPGRSVPAPAHACQPLDVVGSSTSPLAIKSLMSTGCSSWRHRPRALPPVRLGSAGATPPRLTRNDRSAAKSPGLSVYPSVSRAGAGEGGAVEACAGCVGLQGHCSWPGRRRHHVDRCQTGESVAAAGGDAHDAESDACHGCTCTGRTRDGWDRSWSVDGHAAGGAPRAPIGRGTTSRTAG